jgi:isoleucyl-tRNA synthetase
LQKLIFEVTASYEDFVFHRVFALIYNFCSVEMSSIYMDVLKDRMYCDAQDSPSRRSAQTVMYRILDALVRMLAPILAHTSEEAWALMKYKSQDVDTVHLAQMPKVDESIDFRSTEPRWQKLMALRDEVLRVLEGLRRDKKIASNQEACVTICCNDEQTAFINDFGLKQFAALCIVSEVRLQKGTETTVVAQKSEFEKCQRCWNYWPTVGADSSHPGLCERCAKLV